MRCQEAPGQPDISAGARGCARIDVALEPECPNPRAHPRWMQLDAALHDPVVPRSRP